MPMRAYRASTAYVGAHVSANMWRWIIISAVVTAVLWVLAWKNPNSNVWAHILAVCGMICGTLLMIQGERGPVPSSPLLDDKVEVVTSTTPQA
ncbi:hypothetical protein JMJ55_27015 [Belnapia sp. T6]|uniref:Uncharacterized protein n=1 Tax=Belnapia mucosa TaxID=2804532 RepID=A0ABS1VBC8_9PROT|nr:hypothetical protein [Belnapia mucosa]MBL6458986.1 hypothetical protein [Belnapia mucosa]